MEAYESMMLTSIEGKELGDPQFLRMIQLGKRNLQTFFPDGVSKVADLPSDFFS